MSGGSFNYAYNRVNEFAEELEDRIIRRFEKNRWGEEPYDYNDETIDHMREIVIEAKRFAEVMRAVEWLYSCDIGEDTFMERSAPSHSPPQTD
jgi:hypothetical protein